VRLRQMASAGTQSQQIARAIDWLKTHFTQRLRIDDLAAQVNMNTSTFHHHFLALTSHEPAAIPKMAAFERSAALDAHRTSGCNNRGVSDRL
jgi:AraC-like DNA-binding protein